jgi:hypothetical protein
MRKKATGPLLPDTFLSRARQQAVLARFRILPV